MSFKTASVVLASAVATNGSITVGYPQGTTSGHYAGTWRHKGYASGLQFAMEAPTDFTVSFGSSNITVTYKGVTTIPAGTKVSFEFNVAGNDRTYERVNKPVNNILTLPGAPVALGLMYLREISLGAPITAAANAHITSQALTLASGGTTTMTGTLAGTNDVPRNIVAAWTNTAVLTVTGKDQYGNTMVESSASGTSFTGKKAFKSVTSVKVSADVTGMTVGTGVVLGLPVFLSQVSCVLGESQDGAKPTAGTTVAGVTSVATATTGDVRGTYSPNAAPDGSRAYQLFVALSDPTDLGVNQFAG